eukprot:6523572-Pyramimonas_sp.AAC.1
MPERSEAPACKGAPLRLARRHPALGSLLFFVRCLLRNVLIGISARPCFARGVAGARHPGAHPLPRPSQSALSPFCVRKYVQSESTAA